MYSCHKEILRANRVNLHLKGKSNKGGNIMPINLSKGQKVDLTKRKSGTEKNIMVGLGWDVNAFDTGADFDPMRAAFMCGST